MSEAVPEVPRRQRWLPPTIAELPPLTALTLQSGGASPTGDAITGSGGSSGLTF